MSRWPLALVALLGCHTGASSGDTRASSGVTGFETIMTDDFTGERGMAWPAPTDGYTPMGPLAIDGTRLLMGRDAALVAMPRVHGKTLSRSDQTVLYTSTGSEVWLLDRVGKCIVGSDGSSTYGWILPSGGAVVTHLPQAWPVLRDDARGLFWGQPGPSASSSSLVHLATDTTCDPGAGVPLGQVPITAQWLDADDTSLYASGVIYGPGGVNDYHDETYAVPMAGGAANRVTPARPEPPHPAADGDFHFGDLVLHVESSTASLERVTATEQATLWTAATDEQLGGRAEDADSLYFTTNTQTCVEMGTCMGRGPPGSTQPCCSKHYYQSHLYRAAK
jgi:hypothetical protein